MVSLQQSGLETEKIFDRSVEITATISSTKPFLDPDALTEQYQWEIAANSNVSYFALDSYDAGEEADDIVEADAVITTTGTADIDNLPVEYTGTQITLIDTTVDTQPTVPSVENKTFTQAEEITAFTLPETTDGSGNGTITYTLSALPSGLVFDAETRTVSGTATEVGTTQMTYTATDQDGDSAETTFSIIINAASLGLVGTPSITTDNADASYAKEGDTLTLTFTTSEALQTTPTVTIAGQTATVTNTDNDYTSSI